LLVLQWVALALGGSITAVLLSLQLHVVRDLVARQINGVLESTFAGKVVVERIGELSLTGVEGARVRIRDPSGSQVLFVDDASCAWPLSPHCARFSGNRAIA
jgi:hypothetical protein